MHQAPACDRAQLVDAIAAFVAHKGGIDPAMVRRPVERAIDDLGAASVDALQMRLAQPSEAWAYYPRDPLAQRVHHALASLILREPPQISGQAHLDEIRGTEHMFGIGEQKIGAAKISMTIGRPTTIESIRAVTGADRRAFVDRLGDAVAALLPVCYRGVYAANQEP